MAIQAGTVPIPRLDALPADRSSPHPPQFRPETKGFAQVAVATVVLLLAVVVALGGWVVVLAAAYS